MCVNDFKQNKVSFPRYCILLFDKSKTESVLMSQNARSCISATYMLSTTVVRPKKVYGVIKINLLPKADNVLSTGTLNLQSF